MTWLERFYVWTACDLKQENLPIRIGQLRARLASYPTMIATQLLVGPLLCTMLWDVVPQHVLLGWLAVQWALHGVEAYHWWRYRDCLTTLEECARWRSKLLLFVSLLGGLWGAAGVLMFVPGDLGYQALMICVILGVAAGAVTLNPVFPPSMYIFLLLLIIPVALLNLSIGDVPHFILGVLLFVYLGFVLNAGRELSRTFEQSLRGEYENSRLIGQLMREKERAEEARREVEVASLMKSKFFAAANHDLRQPMHALAMYVEVLKSGPQPGKHGEVIAQMERSIEVMCAMFDTLLDLSKLDAGVVQPTFAKFSFGPMLDGLRSEFSMMASDKGVRLDIASSAEVFYSDPLLLERILRNLISNALRYTEQGWVRVSCRREGEGALVEVSDTGIGISQEHLPHIFEEYYQVSNKQRDRSKGLGLGLAIVRRLTRLLGLQLQVKSEQGVGSSFSFVVPLHAPDVMMQAKSNSRDGRVV